MPENEKCPDCGRPTTGHRWQDRGGRCTECLITAFAAAQAVVDKLPKTVDGVPIVPGMTVWPRGDLFIGDEQGAVVKLILWDDLSGEVELDARHCYSTEAAALAAKEAGNG